MNRRLTYLLLLLSAITSALCASPTSFCKCTCFTNSTIIPLNGPNEDVSTPSRFHHLTLRSDDDTFSHLWSRSGSSSSSSSSNKTPVKDKRTCNDCNRQFCLDYNLPICKGAKEEDVLTTCFQRDSAKDEAIVFLFIGATVGLLLWAGVRPWVEGWIENIRSRHSYNPLRGDGI